MAEDIQAIQRETLIAYIEEMKNFFLTEQSVNNFVLHTRYGAKLLERNMLYEEDELVYSDKLPFFYRLLCISSGVTDNIDSNFGGPSESIQTQNITTSSYSQTQPSVADSVWISSDGDVPAEDSTPQITLDDGTILTSNTARIYTDGRLTHSIEF